MTERRWSCKDKLKVLILSLTSGPQEKWRRSWKRYFFDVCGGLRRLCCGPDFGIVYPCGSAVPLRSSFQGRRVLSFSYDSTRHSKTNRHGIREYTCTSGFRVLSLLFGSSPSPLQHTADLHSLDPSFASSPPPAKRSLHHKQPSSSQQGRLDTDRIFWSAGNKYRDTLLKTFAPSYQTSLFV